MRQVLFLMFLLVYPISFITFGMTQSNVSILEKMQCPYYSNTYPQSTLTQHILYKHAQSSPCPTCPTQLTSLQWKTHKHTKNGASNTNNLSYANNRWKCDVCSKVFSKRTSLRSHIQKDHNSNASAQCEKRRNDTISNPKITSRLFFIQRDPELLEDFDQVTCLLELLDKHDQECKKTRYLNDNRQELHSRFSILEQRLTVQIVPPDESGRCSFIDLSDLAINDIDGLSTIPEISSVEAIYLENNQISTLQPIHFLGLNNLKILNLSENPIKTIPRDLFEMLPTLEELYLNDTQLSEEEKEELKNIAKNKNIVLML